MKMETLLKWAHHVSCRLKRQPTTKLDASSAACQAMKDRLQANERALLLTVGFDVTIRHSSWWVIRFIDKLTKDKLLDSSSQRQLGKLAYEWCHCAFGGEFCVRYVPELLACVLLYGASHDLQIEIRHPEGKKWWHLFLPTHAQVTELELNDIMLEIYQYTKLYMEPRRYHLAVAAKAKAAKDGAPAPPSAEKEKEKPLPPPLDPSFYRPRSAPAPSSLPRPAGGSPDGRASSPPADTLAGNAPDEGSAEPPASKRARPAPLPTADELFD